jgi:hypothetical protein
VKSIHKNSLPPCNAKRVFPPQAEPLPFGRKPGIARVAAMPTEPPDLWPWLFEDPHPHLGVLSDEARTRIKARLLIAYSFALSEGCDYPDSLRIFHEKAFNILADEFLHARLLTEAIVSDCIPAMVCDAEQSVGIGPGRHVRGKLAALKRGLKPQIAGWHGRLLLDDSERQVATMGAHRKSSLAPSSSRIESPAFATEEDRRAAVATYQQRWRSEGCDWSYDDITEAAFDSRDRQWMHRWLKGELADKKKSERSKLMERFLTEQHPPKIRCPPR